jgi:hypothetical protein
MVKQLQIEIPVVWHYVKKVADAVAQALNDYPENVRYVSVMVASELVENAIKYGRRVPSLIDAQFSLQFGPQAIEIEVANGVLNEESVAMAQATIQLISSTEDKEELYLNRMREIMINPKVKGQLGLYRIAHEGQFQLSCTYVDQILTVRAVLGLK